jgi:hypothetical protein
MARGPRIDAAFMPEKRLMLAVLDDALTTLRRRVGTKPVERRQFAEAKRWFASNDRT